MRRSKWHRQAAWMTVREKGRAGRDWTEGAVLQDPSRPCLHLCPATGGGGGATRAQDTSAGAMGSRKDSLRLLGHLAHLGAGAIGTSGEARTGNRRASRDDQNSREGGSNSGSRLVRHRRLVVDPSA